MSSQTSTSRNNTQMQGIGMGMGRGGGRRNMGAPIEKPKDSKGTLRRLLAYFANERGRVLLMFAIVTASVVLGLIAPGLLSRAIDSITQHNFEALPRLLILMLLCYVVNSAVGLLQEYIGAGMSLRITKQMRAELFNTTIDLPVAYIDNHSHGDLISRMTNDAENISNVISSSLTSLFSGILTLIGTVAVMLWYSPRLTLLSCSVIVFSVLFTQFLSKFIRRFYVKRQQLLGQINGIVEEKINNFKTVTAYNLQDAVIEDFNQTSDELARTGITAEIISSAMGPVMNMLSNISFVVVAVFGAYYVLNGSITVGVISAFIIYSKQFSRPVNALSQLYGSIQTAMAGAERIFEIQDAPPEDKSGDVHMETTKGVIEFKHVDFSYVPEKKVINDFNLHIEAGKKIALVGSTGSGKTTVVNLLMRFYDIDSGEITLDGVNIKDIDCHDLRDLVGIVLQDTVLFTDTIENNLTYAHRDATREEILSAAVSSKVDRIVQALPEGYQTMLLDQGDNLSQGERQLVAIGRAFLSKPYILILDEATSNIDTKTETDIQDAMVELMKGRTSLIIAHRLSTIQDADLIVVMDQGSIVETGTHEELLAKGGVYYELYMTQFAGQET
ncbi:MAG: ABC transporter ATP-binding protein [Mogibacterium sp.]|nr:ABC transporter ATP-binding protein [Mogibacterium sp.]